MTTCPWCKHSTAEVYARADAGDDMGAPDNLCRPHLAEHDGMSVAELDRMEDEQAAEYLDWVG